MGRRQRTRKACRVLDAKEDELTHPLTPSTTRWGQDPSTLCACCNQEIRAVCIYCPASPLAMTVRIPQTGGETEAARNTKGLVQNVLPGGGGGGGRNCRWASELAHESRAEPPSSRVSMWLSNLLMKVPHDQTPGLHCERNESPGSTSPWVFSFLGSCWERNEVCVFPRPQGPGP